MHSISRKILTTTAILGVFGAIAGAGVFALFTSQTENTANAVTAGTVAISDNDAGSSMYTLPNAKPSDTKVSCIRVNYSGTLDADVKLYIGDTIGALGPYVNLKIESGTQPSPTFPTCTGFVADSTAIYDGTLSAFATAHSSYTNGLVDNPGIVATKWAPSDAVVYRITATLDPATPDAQQAGITNAHKFTWAAKNQ